ncbi:P-II family nitrogen regulator, partial [Methanothrix sp.]|uniref:P-II family nitrogen regulator n=1 Tax=Methanothrix sp. TaxID=90426 RepID=UPI0034541D0A
MKMIWAVIRPERVDAVVSALKAEGFSAMTRFDVYGRGKQKGIAVAGESYDMPKTVLMLVLEAVKIIEDAARTGAIGDGRIFVVPVEEAP